MGDALKQLETLGRASIPHAALLMHMHQYTLREYVDKGFVSVLVIGRRNWVTREEIDRYNQEGKRSPESPDTEYVEPRDNFMFGVESGREP
jgi:glutaredoxin